MGSGPQLIQRNVDITEIGGFCYLGGTHNTFEDVTWSHTKIFNFPYLKIHTDLFITKNTVSLALRLCISQ